MPLFRLLGARGGPETQRVGKKKQRTGRSRKTDEDGSVPSLTQLCLLSLADNMKDVWVKDYADKYLDQYSFRYVMGPFNLLPGKLVEELTGLLCARKQLSRAALHLLLVPQIHGLSLDTCPGLITPVVCSHITARCQGLRSLDLSGAQQLSSKVLCETLGSLPALRSLSLAGVHCDRCVVRTIALRCRFLRHLDVSRCHFLSPAALLPLVGGDFCSSSASASWLCFRCNSASQSAVSSLTSDPNSSCSAPLSPLPLRSLLALDIGFGEQDRECVAAAAYLLLSLQELERVAMEGITQACALIEHREFSQADEFTDREGVPSMKEVWRRRQGMDRERREGTAAVNEEHEDDEEEEEEEAERMLWEACEDVSEEDASRGEGASCSLNQTEQQVRALSRSGDGHLILRLKDIKGLTCDFLDSVGRLCPGVHSVSVNVDDQERIRGRSQVSLLTAGLQTWSGQLQSLSVNFSGPLGDLLPALQVAGSSLVSLSLEGVKTSPHTPLLDVIRACPRLRNLLISAEPPTVPQWEDDQVDEDPPRLPYLSSLTLNFSYDHSQMMPVLSWMSLKKELECLLTGSPLLEKLSLVALPCLLNSLIQNVLRVGRRGRCRPADFHLMPLARLQHVELLRTNVDITTVESLIKRSKRLKFIDLSYCWGIKQTEWMHCKTRNKVEIVWM